MHTGLGPGAQMLFRHNWTKLDTLLDFFTVLVIVVAHLLAMSFLYGVGHVLSWIFLVWHFYWYACNCVPKLTDREWIDFGVCVLECASFGRRRICID